VDYIPVRGDGRFELHIHESITTPDGVNIDAQGDGVGILDEPVERFAKVLREKAIDIVAGPSERAGATGRILSVYFRDPDGNLVEVSNRVAN
jgi:catechol 2,3-dioxygenase-like lactoylglutathione lyase family enzyme